MIKKGIITRSDKYWIYGILFMLPFFLFLFVFTIMPIVYSFYLSLTSWNGTAVPPKIIGLENFKSLLKDELFFKSLKNTFIIWIIGFIPQFSIALILAVLLTAKRVPGTNFFRAAFYLPNLVTMASVGTLFAFIMDWQSGSLNRLLIAINLINEPINWLVDVFYARSSVSFTLFWMWFGHTMIFFMAGLKAIPPEFYEAAYVDGANTWHAFWKITLPLLRVTMIYIIITSIIGGMSMFDVPYIVSGGTGLPDDATLTSVMYIYNTAFKYNNHGYASTLGVGLFIVIMLFVVISFRFLINKTSKIAE